MPKGPKSRDNQVDALNKEKTNKNADIAEQMLVVDEDYVVREQQEKLLQGEQLQTAREEEQDECDEQGAPVKKKDNVIYLSTQKKTQPVVQDETAAKNEHKFTEFSHQFAELLDNESFHIGVASDIRADKSLSLTQQSKFLRAAALVKANPQAKKDMTAVIAAQPHLQAALSQAPSPKPSVSQAPVPKPSVSRTPARENEMERFLAIYAKAACARISSGNQGSFAAGYLQAFLQKNHGLRGAMARLRKCFSAENIDLGCADIKDLSNDSGLSF